MYSRESDRMNDRRMRQQESNPFQRSLRSEGKDRAESKADRRAGKAAHDESPLKTRERSINQRDFPLQSRASCKHDALFQGHEIKQLMESILDKELSARRYDSNACKDLCLTLSEDIKQKVKDLGMTRYRIICHVSIGSCSGQGLLMASRFVWNNGKDNYVTATFRNVSLFAVATVFGVVKE